MFTKTSNLAESNSKLAPLQWAAAEIPTQLIRPPAGLFLLNFLESCPNMFSSGVSQVFEGSLYVLFCGSLLSGIYLNFQLL